MARGWESKSVEEQQAEAAVQKQPAKAKISSQEATLLRKLEGLRLSRQHVLQQLSKAGDQRLRQILEQALADLDRQINSLKSSNKQG
jgi:division protein CdvB (Snf7/Vps24/ESCRT-III family)